MGVWIETFDENVLLSFLESHPTWVCGLKLSAFQSVACLPRSHPTWVCGLKQLLLTALYLSHCHTLRGCVDWNLFTKFAMWINPVTPYVGVWIETNHIFRICEFHTSHPTWVCGLKPLCNFVFFQPYYVTPYVGVWIETVLCLIRYRVFGSHTLRGCVDWNIPRGIQENIHDWSHPTWVCGLKPAGYHRRDGNRPSHPTWVCGLKLWF